MKYLLLIYVSEEDAARRSEGENAKVMQEYIEYRRRIQEDENYVASAALQSVTTATTVRVREGKTLTTDGPFIETHEQLGGFFLVEAKDLDEAIRLAALIPGAKWGAVEVRPILPTPPL
jgi:hypothetical protein